MTTLKAKTVTIESSLKLFGLDRGMSDGSAVIITFEIEGDGTEADVRRATLEQKEKLDVLVATMELATGAMSNDQYTSRKKYIKGAYDHILKREAK